MENDGKFLTTEELSKRWKISRQTLCQWRQYNKIKFVKLGKKSFLYDLNDIEKLENGKKNI